MNKGLKLITFILIFIMLFAMLQDSLYTMVFFVLDIYLLNEITKKYGGKNDNTNRNDPFDE